MVLLSAAVVTKSGKALVSRQFVEMTKSRVEGLLVAFPKLLTGERQHTFVETEAVRYVYQLLDKVYMVLITTKASNILEDLETLRLFAKVVSEYCRNFDESEIEDNAFHLIFAFDEIVALGYRESVNLAQVRTFVEMDSHEEKVYKAVRETQEKEAKTKMKEKAKELQRKRYEESRKGGSKHSGGFGSNISSSTFNATPSTISSNSISDTLQMDTRAVKPTGGGHAMKLGSRSKDVDAFVNQLKSEGVKVVNKEETSNKIRQETMQQEINIEPVHLVLSEELNLSCGRDGGLINMEIQGILKLRVQNQEFGFIKIQVDNLEQRPIQLQTHPNVDRDLWRSCAQIGMRVASKPFPSNTDVGVLKWRFQTTDNSFIPLSINCWPQENGMGGCDVNIEYTLENEHMELTDVTITIPLVTGVPPPVINDCDGEHVYDKLKSALLWRIPVIDSGSKSGVLDFTARGTPENFFPVVVNFVSSRLYCNLNVVDVIKITDQSRAQFSTETIFKTGAYQIV